MQVLFDLKSCLMTIISEILKWTTNIHHCTFIIFYKIWFVLYFRICVSWIWDFPKGSYFCLDICPQMWLTEVVKWPLFFGLPLIVATDGFDPH